MKNKALIIIIIIAVIAVAILIAAKFFPALTGDDSTGTIGKAEKFRKGQFTADDILLNDDILKDTAAVGKTLDQIFSFGAFMTQEKLLIDSMWIKEIKNTCLPYPGCTECVNCEKSVKILQDYSSFLANNQEVIKSTCVVLLEAYNGEQKDFSFDIGVKILSFVQFVDEMITRDSVLTSAIRMVDQYITNEKTTDKKRLAEIKKLKEVRDRMVIDNLLFAMKTGDKKQADIASSFTLCSSAKDLGLVVNSSGANGLSNAGLQSTHQLKGTLCNAGLGVYSLSNNPNLGIYNSSRLDAAFVGSRVLSTDNAGNVVRDLGVVYNAVGLSNIGNKGNDLNSLILNTVIGVSYNNIVNAAPLGLVTLGNSGTVFNSANLNLALSNR